MKAIVFAAAVAAVVSIDTVSNLRHNRHNRALNPISTLSSDDKAKLKTAAQTCGVDYSKMQNFDEKTWGIDLIPEAGKFFKTVVKLSPQQLKDAGGLEPSKRDEINFFKDGAGAYQPFDVPAASVLKKSLGVSKVCQFIFAFPAADDADSAVSPALKTLGWLPEAGKTSFMYIFKAPVNALYGSVGAKIASGSEIGFGQLVPFSSVVAAYEIDSKGKVVKTFDANAIAALKA